MGHEFQDFNHRGGDPSYGTDMEARNIASLLDSGQFEQAQQRLINDLYQYGPQRFQEIVTQADRYERSQYGADIILTPMDNNQNYFDQRNGWQNPNQRNNNQRDYMVSIIMPYQERGRSYNQFQQQSFVRSDLAIITIGARPLDGRPYYTR
ncbi:MAG: hypothetical protein K8F91_08085 [Candidatus Obscuribacterales bacterium]|nr:hypothetical protein [Candidatus Obscuribacterales bacterium]